MASGLKLKTARVFVGAVQLDIVEPQASGVGHNVRAYT